MKIRTRLLLSVVPPVIALFVVSGSIGFMASRSGLYNLQSDALRFKAQLLRNQMISQWNLLVDFSLFAEEGYILTAQQSIQDFAETILKPPLDSEEDEGAKSPQLIFAVISEQESGLRSLALSTDPDLVISQENLAALFAESENEQGEVQFNTARIGRDQYAYTAFYFEPFRWTVFIGEKVRIFNVSIRIVQRVLIITAPLFIAMLFIILFILSQSLTRPLSNMAKSARNIMEDTLNIKADIPYEYDDEAGTLALTFNSMFKELDGTYENLKQYAFESAVAQRQEKRIRTIFQKYVPQDLINRYIKNPESLLVGENRKVAVLFSDIRSFSTISEKMKPDELVLFLNRYLAKVIEIIVHAEGVVDKFIGDAVMALFGAPIVHSDDALRAVESGLKMLSVVDELNQKATREKFPTFKIGMGINFGTVTVGNIGSDQKVEYTAIGDEVNLASRLEGLCKHYQQSIIISGEVATAIKERHQLRFIDKVIVKGKSEITQVYTIPPPTEKSINTEALRAYHSGVSHYYKKAFQEAQSDFKRAQQQGLDDNLTQQFLVRSVELIKRPPAANAKWNGAVPLEEK